MLILSFLNVKKVPGAENPEADDPGYSRMKKMLKMNDQENKIQHDWLRLVSRMLSSYMVSEVAGIWAGQVLSEM